MRLHELHVEQFCRRQKHATRLVHAIEEGVPAGCALEVCVHASSSNAMSFYAALNVERHAQPTACSSCDPKSQKVSSRSRS